MIRRVNRIAVKDGDLDKVQREVSSILNEVVTNPFLKGRAVTITVGTSDTPYLHGLGYIPAGYIVTGMDADARVWESAERTSTTLTLRASASVTVDLWVY